MKETNARDPSATFDQKFDFLAIKLVYPPNNCAFSDLPATELSAGEMRRGDRFSPLRSVEGGQDVPG